MTDHINRTIAGVRLALALVGLSLAVLAVVAVVWVSVTPSGVPKYRLVAQQGMTRSIVVDEEIAANDAALLAIADSLLPRMPGRAVMLMVWTDDRMVPRGNIADMTDAQLAARRAVVTINLNTGYRKVEGRVK